MLCVYKEHLGATCSNRLRDIMDGKPSEPVTQNGAVMRLGQEVGVETPVNNKVL
jgi:ketopantoate reductase